MSRDLARPLPHPGERHPRPSTTAVVALGTNLGDRAETIERATEALARLPLVDDVRLSPVIESVAVTLEGPDATAPAYLNAVALVQTRLAPSVLLSFLHRIEADHGRERGKRWADRTLDLDLIAYGDVQVDTDTLTVPHPRAAERDFVLGPWLALDPDAVLPGRGRVDALLRALDEGGGE